MDVGEEIRYSKSYCNRKRDAFATKVKRQLKTGRHSDYKTCMCLSSQAEKGFSFTGRIKQVRKNRTWSSEWCVPTVDQRMAFLVISLYTQNEPSERCTLVQAKSGLNFKDLEKGKKAK